MGDRVDDGSDIVGGDNLPNSQLPGLRVYLDLCGLGKKAHRADPFFNGFRVSADEEIYGASTHLAYAATG